jgi:hypothetical protein
MQMNGSLGYSHFPNARDVVSWREIKQVFNQARQTVGRGKSASTATLYLVERGKVFMLRKEKPWLPPRLHRN